MPYAAQRKAGKISFFEARQDERRINAEGPVHNPHALPGDYKEDASSGRK
ncbi:MAG: hypothetical protein ACLTLQ_03210 [[Clostridium] scindens]